MKIILIKKNNVLFIGIIEKKRNFLNFDRSKKRTDLTYMIIFSPPTPHDRMWYDCYVCSPYLAVNSLKRVPQDGNDIFTFSVPFF